MISSFSSCELLSVLYICGVIHSINWKRPVWLAVVNCFQFFIFAVLFTVGAQYQSKNGALWIAFSSLYLRCYSQFALEASKFRPRCELLSVLYICGVIHSKATATNTEKKVVNCFQFFIFAVLFTVLSFAKTKNTQLWIAFSSLYLRCYSQSDGNRYKRTDGCELLSVLYICGVIHSFQLTNTGAVSVVNCFQFFIFAVLFTVNSIIKAQFKRLWIAFSSLYLRCYSQFLVIPYALLWGCELLSVLYICGVIHSFFKMIKKRCKVVNCFQFFIFAVLFTVIDGFDLIVVSCELLSVLYICGVIHSVIVGDNVREQVVNCFQFFIFAVLFTVIKNAKKSIPCCELLSVLYICGVIHSVSANQIARYQVVNCFQFFIFAVLFTVPCRPTLLSRPLWIAFSSLYLRCYSQFTA